jgi:hypothetical protein
MYNIQWKIHNVQQAIVQNDHLCQHYYIFITKWALPHVTRITVTIETEVNISRAYKDKEAHISVLLSDQNAHASHRQAVFYIMHSVTCSNSVRFCGHTALTVSFLCTLYKTDGSRHSKFQQHHANGCGIFGHRESF